MPFSIGSSGGSQERIPLLGTLVRKPSKKNIQRGPSIDRNPKEEVANSASLTCISPWQWTANGDGDAVPIDTMKASDSDTGSALRRASVSAYLKSEEASLVEESEPEDVGGVSEEVRQSIARLSESIGNETASASVARVLAAQKSEPPIFFQEEDGHIHEVKLLLTSLPEALYGLAVPTDPTVVLDSETGQKDKASLKLLTQIKKVLKNESTNNLRFLDTPYSGLNKNDKGEIDASVASLLEKAKAAALPFLENDSLTSFLDKVPKETAPNSPTLRALLTSTSQGLIWKLAHVGDQTGQGGILTANHLGVKTDNALFSRSARFNSPDKMKAVLEGAAWQESQKLTRVLEANSDSAIAELFNAFGTEAGITKEEAQQLNTFFRQEGVHLYIETNPYGAARDETRPLKLCMMTNLISAMDSTKKDERPFWDSLRVAHDQIYKEALTFTDNERVIHIEPPLLTESSQSSFAAGTIALYHPSENPIQTKLGRRGAQLEFRLDLLRKSQDILGDGCTFTRDFKEVLGKPSPRTDRLKHLAASLRGAEKAFVDYMIILRDQTHQGDFDRFFTPATNVMTLEMGDVAFAELCGIHDHVSCKSGQDRTLTLTALRLAIADAGWPRQPEADAEYKSKFAVAFFKAVATQAKPVVEHARGIGGKLKFNLGELPNEQPIPGALFRYMQSPYGEDARFDLMKIITEDPNLREGLKTVKMPTGLLGIIVDADASVATIGETTEERALLKSFFTKKQSQGKKALVALFQKTIEIKKSLEAFEAYPLSPHEQKAQLKQWETELKEALSSAEDVQPKLSTRAMVGVKIKTAQTTQLKAYFKQYATRVLVNIQDKGDEKVSLHKAIEKHKTSTESQLEVALSNFELAAGRFKIDPYDITQEVAKLRSQRQTAISQAYTEGTDLKSIDRTFRDKEDDFGLTATLKAFLAKSGTTTGAQGSKQAMEKTKAAAIDRQGEKKSTKGISKEFTLPNGTRYTTEIQKKTSRFVSSASNESVGNTAGNLNLQTLSNAAGAVLFKTLRHAALTAEPNTKTADPLNPFITAADRASLICKLPFAEAKTALGKYGLEASITERLYGKFDEKSLAKKLAKQCGLLNKALDVAKAAWEAKGQPDGPVTITSLSLMTPDRPREANEYRKGKIGEIGKLNDQVKAFRLLADLSATDLENTRMFSKKGASLDNLNFEVMTFNFGVNEGESLGATHQKRLNDEAIAELMRLSDTKTAALEAQLAQPGLSAPAETARLTVERDTVAALKANIDELYTTYTQPFKYHIPRFDGYHPLRIINEFSYAGNSVRNLVNPKGWWRADQAYNLTAKIAFLTELCEGVNTCNCASGKDRTGMHVQNALNYAALMRDRMDVRMGDLKYKQMSPQDQIKHLDAHHFDVLEAAAKDIHVTEVTDFIKCIKEKGASLTASDLKPFLKDESKALNLEHGQNAPGTKLTAIYGQLLQNPKETLSEENFHTFAEIKNILLISGQGSLSNQDDFMADASRKLKEKKGIGVASTWEMITDLTNSEADKAELQARNRAFMLETGQHEVQEWNTGSPGYKLYSGTLPNLVTRGGQTEKYFMRMFGLTADEVAEWVTMQAKYNDT